MWARPLAGLARRLPGRGRGGGAGRRLPPGVRQVERFDAAAEAAYRRVAPRLGAHVVRDLRHLDWRYSITRPATPGSGSG